jgi:DNA-binding protein Fis
VRGSDVAPLLGSGQPATAPARANLTLHRANVGGTTHESIPAAMEAMIGAQIDAYFAAYGEELPATGLYDRLLARLEKPLIVATLRATGGNQIKAADVLGVNRNTLRKKMRDLAINAKSLMLKDAA